MKARLFIIAMGTVIATAAAAQTPNSRSPERESDRIINRTAPDPATATQERESKPPADSTEKSQSGEASPTGASK